MSGTAGTFGDRSGKILGLNRNTRNNLVNEHAGISPDMAVRLSKAFDSSAKIRLGMQMDHDLAQAEAKADTIDVQPVPRPETEAETARP